jgi:hypothetical protein
MPRGGVTRIHWTSDEKAQVVEHAAELILAGKMSRHEPWNHQISRAEKVLPEHRRRHIRMFSLSSMGWFVAGLEARLDAARTPPPTPAPVPEPPPAPALPAEPAEPPLPLPAELVEAAAAPPPLLGELGAEGVLLALLQQLFARMDLQRRATDAVRGELAKIVEETHRQVAFYHQERERMAAAFEQMEVCAQALVVLMERAEDVASAPALSPNPPGPLVLNPQGALRRIGAELERRVAEFKRPPVEPGPVRAPTEAEAERLEREQATRRNLKIAVIGIPTGTIENAIRRRIDKGVGTLKFFREIEISRLAEYHYVFATTWVRTDWLTLARKQFPAGKLVVQRGGKEDIPDEILALDPVTAPAGTNHQPAGTAR